MGKHSSWSTLGLLLFLPTTVVMVLTWVWGWARRWLDGRRDEGTDGQSRRLQQSVNVEFPIPEKVRRSCAGTGTAKIICVVAWVSSVRKQRYDLCLFCMHLLGLLHTNIGVLLLNYTVLAKVKVVSFQKWL